MQIIHQFSGPSKKGLAFHGWAGPINEWEAKSAPKIAFGAWKRDPASGGGTVTFECQPFQLCLFGANSKKMAVRDKFTYFAFAGLGMDGQLRLQKLPEGADAREVFAAGGWTPPAIPDLVSRVAALADLDFSRRLDEAMSIIEVCSIGYGMGFSLRHFETGSSKKLDAIKTFICSLDHWPQLSEVAQAFRLFLDAYTQEWESRQKGRSATRRAAFERAVLEMKTAGGEITPIHVAAWSMGIKEVGESIPHAIKEKARKLKKEFADFFNNI